jgi:RHS repeat-associated protein
MNLLHRFPSAGRKLVSVAAFLFLLLNATVGEAHYCGPPIIRCHPGDIITYYIISDRAEEGVSGYSVFGQTDPSVASVVHYTPLGRIFGMFVMKAHQVGTAQFSFFWNFPDHNANGFCLVEVRVSNVGSTTAGNHPWSTYVGDPVNAYTGELVTQEQPDLFLGGPMPLYFSRYYASRLQADSLVNSRLGNNWSHNFEWRALVGMTNEAAVISPEGFVARFNKSGANWVLQSPKHLPFQLVTSGSNTIFGDPRDNRLYTFNTNGFLTKISDGKGNNHTLTYTNDTLIRVADGRGRQLTFEYVGPQLLRKVSDGIRSVGFQQQQSGNEFNLIRITNTLSQVTSHTYDNSKNVGSLLTGTTYPAGNSGYSQVYDSEGRVIQQTRGTNATKLFYNTNTFTTFVTNAAGNLSTYRHSGNGHLLSLSDSAGESILLSTNAQGRRKSVTDRTGSTLGIAYDLASGQPSFITNADGTITAFTYTNRVVNGIRFYELASVRNPDGTTEQFAYTATGNLKEVRDRAGKVSRMSYNAFGQPLSITNAIGGVITMTYNADGTMATQADPESGMIRFGHDALRRATNGVASDGRMIRLKFDHGDRITSITDERANTTHFGFDLNDRLVAVTNNLGKVTRYNYDGLDRTTNITDRLGHPISFGFDALNQLTAVTNRNGNRMQLNYDPRQRISSIIDPGSRTWAFGYNDEDAMTSFTTPLAAKTSVRRDKMGFVSVVTNAMAATTKFNRDVMHRVTAVTNPVARVDSFRYDARGLMTNTITPVIGTARAQFNDLGLPTRIIDHRNNSWLFNYSAHGRLTKSIDPLNRTNQIFYDTRGRARRLIYADGSTQTNTYDAAGNLIGLGFSGAPATTFSYDALNRLTNTANLALSYDAEDRLTNTVSSGISFGAAYDAGGRLTNVTYKGGLFSVGYSYDSRDRLVRVRDTLANAQIDFFYDAAGRLTNVVRANGVNGVYGYDAVGNTKRIREGAFMDLKYSYNLAGALASLDSTAPLSAAPVTPQTNAFTYNAAQQISNAGYAYDARGRATASPGRTYAWNTTSKLTRAGTITNAYNGAGNLLTRGTSSGSTRYHYNHAINRTPIMAEQNTATSQFLRYYVWTPSGSLLYMINANGNVVSYYHFDRAGSTLALTSSAGTVTDAYSYTPYGVPVGRTGTSSQPFTFLGRHGVRWDSAARIYHMRARFYEPVTARFLSRDPLWPRFSDPMSLDPYNYAANNPLQYIDPTGTRPEGDLSAPSPVSVVGREMIDAAPGGRNLDSLLDLAKLPDKPSSSGSPMNLNIGRTGALVLIDGRRSPSSTSGVDDIPISMIDRLETIRDGNAAIYGSDAVAGVVNVITKKTDSEFNNWNINAGYRYEPKLTVGLNYTAASDPPPAATQPQPTRVNSQVMLYQLVPEMTAVAAYGASLQRLRGLGGSQGYQLLQAISMYSMFPSFLPPRGVAFVNGQYVHTKPQDLLYAVHMKRDFYDFLDYYEITPAEVYRYFISSLALGGSGGIFNNLMAREQNF